MGVGGRMCSSLRIHLCCPAAH
uniref:Uncharacterized protein n=1 Tax=Anopheles dirus TaxID=7168 RepID=A0A182NYM4_9DIPT